MEELEARRCGEGLWILAHLFPAWQEEGALRAGVAIAWACDGEWLGQVLGLPRGGRQTEEVFQGVAGGESMGELDDGALGVAVEEDVGLGVKEDGAADFVAPVVVVGEAAQARFDAAKDDGDVGEGLAAALGVDRHGPVWASPGLSIGGVGVVGARLPIGGVVVDHGVHVASADAKEEVGWAEGSERGGIVPGGLVDDAHPEAVGL